MFGRVRAWSRRHPGVVDILWLAPFLLASLWNVWQVLTEPGPLPIVRSMGLWGFLGLSLLLIVPLLKAGASGFLLKDVPPSDLISAIRSVHGGDAVVAPSTTRRLLERFAVHLPSSGAAEPSTSGGLTAREREVLVLVARGLSNTEIAGRLDLAEATVKTHLGRVLAKLGLRDRAQVVVYAYESGLVTPHSAG